MAKHTQETIEDGIVVTDCFCAVIDGSTSKSPYSISPSVSNGQLCMTVVSDVIRGLSPDATCQEFCEKATEAICQCYVDAGIPLQQLREHPTERASASAVVYSVARSELWLVGDCHALVDGVYHSNEKPQEAPLAERRSMFILKALETGSRVEDFMTKSDPGRKHILPELIAACKGQNVIYAVLDGFPVYQKGVKIVDCADAHELVLASDGYPFLCPTLEQSELQLKHLLSEDPLCIRIHKATKGLLIGNKSFDDRAYLRIQI